MRPETPPYVEPRRHSGRRQIHIEFLSECFRPFVQHRQRGVEHLRRFQTRQRRRVDSLYWAVFNLDRKNPNAKDDFEHLPPEQLADDILQKELRIAEIMREIKELLGRKPL